MADIKSKVVEIIVKKLGVEESQVTDSANFTKDLGADSLDTVELIMEFEKEFEVGVVSPIGNNVKDFWQSMMEGKGGAAPITRFDSSEFDTKFACEVKNYDPLIHLNKKEIQRLDLFTQYALSAATMAIEDSELNLEKINKDRAGVVFGSGIGGMWTYHNQQQELYARGGKPDRISPFFIPMLISDIAPGHIAIRWGLKGPNYGTVSACATSSHSLSDA
ncbi:MAG: acyl carrier protein, partial [Ignavibacteriae bacterium]|nr:acyl carrier protein [Ignavibacteriota bacterium]